MSADLNTNWPPSLKEWVAKCLGQITDSNRAEVQAELKKVIGDAFSAQTLWTTDWAGVQLQSLLPKPLPVYNLGNALKRKSLDNNNFPSVVKKAKKTAGKTQSAVDFNDQMALNKRAQRFQREHEIEKNKHLRNVSQSTVTKSHHQNGYLLDTSRSASPYGPSADEPEGDPNLHDWDKHAIVGTSQALLKDYLRLTSEPKPETIRPLPVLMKTLNELKLRWKAKKDKPSYNWICSQFKSLRQDLTVQRIKTEFTVQVYEIHARIALESNDMVEYNQCQGALKTLYDVGIPGKVEEFTAYRILMLLHGRNRSELNLYVGQLTPAQRTSACVKHALEVQRALAMGNYRKLCDLYINAPNMGAYIMDHFIDRERAKALVVMTKAYMTLPLAFISSTLCFDSIQDTHDFLVAHSGAHFKNPNDPDSEKILNCKAAHPSLAQAYEEKYRKVIIKGAI